MTGENIKKNNKMENKNLKNLLFSRNAIRNLTEEEILELEEETIWLEEEILEIEEEVYCEGKVYCVDAIHFDESGYVSDTYTWYIPSGIELDIEIDDLLVVEQIVGIGVAIVKATSVVYEKTKEQHENDNHPYCRVISNIGVINK